MKTQKHGLRNYHEVATFIRQLIAIPFLPGSLITPTYSSLQLPRLENPEVIKLEKHSYKYKQCIRELSLQN